MSDVKTCQECGGDFVRRRKPGRPGAYQLPARAWAAQRFCSRTCAGAARSRPALDRFEQNCLPEPNSGCTLWTGCVGSHGYGVFHDGTRMVLAHRFACERVEGPIPSELDVRHLCHTRTCVNEAHLLSGTRFENVHDSVRDGRHAFGSRTGVSKLDEADVAVGRQLGANPAAFAREHGITPSTARSALLGLTWRHVPPGETGITSEAA